MLPIKNISYLLDEQGVRIHKNVDLQREIVRFYKGLMGASAVALPVVNRETLMNGPLISQHKQLALCAPVREEEIQQALFAIDDNKAPGIDGFNALFFKKSWGIIKKDIIKAVMDVFSQW